MFLSLEIQVSIAIIYPSRRSRIIIRIGISSSFTSNKPILPIFPNKYWDADTIFHKIKIVKIAKIGTPRSAWAMRRIFVSSSNKGAHSHWGI